MCVCQRKTKDRADGMREKVPIPLDGIRTCTSGIRAHRASDCVCVCYAVHSDSSVSRYLPRADVARETVQGLLCPILIAGMANLDWRKTTLWLKDTTAPAVCED